LCPHLSHLQSLQSLDIGFSHLPHDTATALGHTIASVTTMKKRTLDRAFDFLDESEGLLLHLVSLSSLTCLSLNCCSGATRNYLIGPDIAPHDHGSVQWCSQLGRLTSLLHVELKLNHLAVQDAQALGPHLVRLTSLTYLNLSANCFRNKGIASRGPHVACLVRLVVLDLSLNSIGSRGMSALGPHLGRLTDLQELMLGSNTFGHTGARAMVPQLKFLTPLQKLILECPRINSMERESLKQVMLPCTAEML
jgi:hypothetical protein